MDVDIPLQMHSPSPSPRLFRALIAERDALLRRQRQIDRQREQLQARLQSLQRETQVLDERLVLLAQLLSENSPPEESARDESRRLLEGPAIRTTAVAVLRDREEGRGPIHYRRWLAIVEEAGFEVGGKKPSATFLSQITRSPVVVRTSRSGHYSIDREAPSRLRRRLVALRQRAAAGALGEADVDDGTPVDLDTVRERRAQLTREIERTERALAEATAALTLSTEKTARES